MPDTPDFSPGSHVLQPKELNFATPRQSNPKLRSLSVTPSTPGTVSTPGFSDVESIDSNETCMTPELSKLSLGRGRGRPRKKLTVPTMDDFPIDGSEEEKSRYIKKKNTELWRFKKLTSSGSGSYRAEENARVKEYQRRKKAEQESSKDEDDRKTQKKEQSRVR